MTSQQPPAHPLVSAIRSFDYRLQRPVLSRMNMESIEQSLEELDDFHEAVDWLYGEAFEAETPCVFQEEQEVMPPDLAAVGCRLSSDLNEALMLRLAEKLQKQDEAAEALSRQLKQLLTERARTAKLLQKTHDIRQHTLQTGERLGLGLVL